MKTKKLDNREYKTLTAEIEVKVRVVAKVQFEFEGEKGFDVKKALEKHLMRYGQQLKYQHLDSCDVIEILDVDGHSTVDDAVSDMADAGDAKLIKIRK